MTTNHITTTTFFKWSPFFRIILHLSLLLLIQFYRYSSFKIWPHKQQAAQMRPNNSSQSNRQIKNEQHKLYHSTNALLQTHCPHLLCNTQKQIENLWYLVLFPWKNVFWMNGSTTKWIWDFICYVKWKTQIFCSSLFVAYSFRLDSHWWRYLYHYRGWTLF